MRHYANVSSSFTIKLSDFWYLPGSFQRVSIVTSTEICKLFKPKMTENEMVGWHHWFNGHEFEQTLEVGDGQRSLVCCSPWGHKESDTIEWLNWVISSLKWSSVKIVSKNLTVYARIHSFFLLCYFPCT